MSYPNSEGKDSRYRYMNVFGAIGSVILGIESGNVVGAIGGVVFAAMLISMNLA